MKYKPTEYKPTAESEGFDVQLEVQGYALSEFERRHLEEDLHGLRAMLSRFPFARMHVQIHRHARTHSFHVKTAIALPGGRLFTGERNGDMHLAWERCVRKLEKKLESFEERLEQKPQRKHLMEGTFEEPHPTGTVDLEALASAANDLDYSRFRRLIMGYDEALERRIGRWVQRLPRAQAALGTSFTIGDVLEEIYLVAMESFAERPSDRLGNWLEGLIDPAIKLLVSHPDEVEGLDYVRESPPLAE